MIAAAIPLKRLAEAKSRLAPRLRPKDRADLVMAMLRHTVRVLRESGAVDRVALVSPEPEVAESLGVAPLPDTGALNEALQSAVEWAVREQATALLILPGDLPFIGTADVQALVDPLWGHGITLARTHDGGTGALLLAPPDAIEPTFGEDSYRRHVEAARAGGLPVREVRRDALAFDLDTVEDLERLLHSSWPAFSCH